MAGDEQSTDAGGLFRFAHAEFDERAHELRVDGRAVAIEAKALSVLACLLGRPAETLTKDELFESVWPGRVVTEGTLTKAVMKLRAVLGDDGQTIIRTVHGFGYRLGVPVEELSSDAPARFLPAPGQTVPFRPNWRLVESLDPDRRGMVWLAEHAKTRDRRVFKFADGADALVTLKREITLYRLLHDSLGEAAPVVQILDWNLDEPPYFTESEWVEGGDLGQWLAGGADASGDSVGAEAPRETVGGASAPTSPALRDGSVAAEAPPATARTQPLALRLEAMAQICEAVAATHGVGVVHKDLKPANVLVRNRSDGQLQIRLADFGIGALSDARAIEALGITKLGFTRTRSDKDSSSGTPLYLAPEVIGGQMPTQRSDIYALGVMLYQAIVSDPRKPLAPGWERDVDDELLREDIAAAADVDPERRLGDASELARRLRELEARRAARETERRADADRARLAQSYERARIRLRWQALAAVMLLAGIGGTSWMAWRAEVARELALAAAEEAQTANAASEAVNAFLVDDLLSQANPMVSGARDLSVRALLDRAATDAGGRFAERPEVEAQVRLALGQAYHGLGENVAARDQLLQVLGFSAAPARLRDRAKLTLAEVYNFLESHDDAASMLDAAMQSADPGIRLRARYQQALLLHRDRQYREAIEALEALDAEMRERFGEDSEIYLEFLGYRIESLTDSARFEEALTYARRALAALEKRYGPDDARMIPGLTRVGATLAMMDRVEESYPILARRHTLAKAHFAFDHDNVLRAGLDLAYVLGQLGRHAEAEALYREVLDIRLEVYGEDNVYTRDAMNHYSVLLSGLGRHGEALPWMERGYQASLRASGERHVDTLFEATNLGREYAHFGRFEEAESLLRPTLAAVREVFPEDHYLVGNALLGLARAVEGRGKRDEAIALTGEAVAHFQRTVGDDHARTRGALEFLEILHRAAD